MGSRLRRGGAETGGSGWVLTGHPEPQETIDPHHRGRSERICLGIASTEAIIDEDDLHGHAPSTGTASGAARVSVVK